MVLTQLFLYPEWNIGAPLIAVYGDESRDLVLRAIQSSPLGKIFNQRSQSSCDSLSTVSIPFRDDAANSSYLTVHIVVQMYQYTVEWVHVGEVKFLGMSADVVNAISKCFSIYEG